MTRKFFVTWSWALYLPIKVKDIKMNLINLNIKRFMTFVVFVTSQIALAAGPYSYSPDGSEVKDIASGLVWRRCTEGQTWNGSSCAGVAILYAHEASLIHASSQSGWRLPNIKELSSLANKARINPSIDVLAFPGTLLDHYWSSTAYSANGTSAWFVRFDFGLAYTDIRSGTKYIRLVR